MESSVTTSGFPEYDDGDVQIVITPTKIYKLHSVVLRRHSPYFARLLREEDAAKLTKKAASENAIRYRAELVRSSIDEAPQFKLKPVDSKGHTASSSFFFPDILDQGRNVNQQVTYWEWLFGCFYNLNPGFDDANLATVLSGCMGLIDLAELVEAVDHVRGVVDLALLRQGQVLWTSIASNPTAWAELGRRVHSPTMFTEAVIHIVGKWNNMTEKNKKDLHPDIRDLCESKFKELDLAKEAIEMRILGHYPPCLTRIAADRPGRPSYANDIYLWMAICFFRQWFAQAISDGRNRLNADGGYAFYKELSDGDNAYLNHLAFQNFHQYFPMSSKACNILEQNMNTMKTEIKPFVKDIMTNRVNVETANYPLTWLTCTVINKEDWPWTAQQGEEGADDLFRSGSDEEGGLRDVNVTNLAHRTTKGARRNDSSATTAIDED